MTKNLRETLDELMALDEARGVLIDVESGSRHFKVHGTIGSETRMICVVSHGDGKTFETPGRRADNYRTAMRHRLIELRAAARGKADGHVAADAEAAA